MSSLWITKLIPCLFRKENTQHSDSESIGSFLSYTEDDLREPVPIMSQHVFSFIENNSR